MKHTYSTIIGLGSFLLAVTIPLGSANPSIQISDFTLTPEVLAAGEFGILTLYVRNADLTTTHTTVTGDGSSTTTTTSTPGATIENIWISPAQSGGKKIRAASNYLNVGYLAAGAMMQIDFKILVDDSMAEGLYFLTAHIDVNGAVDVQFPIPIRISNETVDLVPTTVPSTIPVGGATKILLTVVNNLDADVSGIKVISTINTDIVYYPENIFVGALAKDTSEVVTFSVEPKNTGEKNLSFTIRYKNGDNIHENHLSIPITIVDRQDVAVILYDVPSTFAHGSLTKVHLKVFNAKSDDITSVIVTPITTARVSPEQYFIGSLDADDVYAVTFDVDVDGLPVNQTVPIEFKVSYKQNTNYYETLSVISSFRVVEDASPDYTVTMVGFVLLIIFFGIGFVIYRKRKQRNNKLLHPRQLS